MTASAIQAAFDSACTPIPEKEYPSLEEMLAQTKKAVTSTGAQVDQVKFAAKLQQGAQLTKTEVQHAIFLQLYHRCIAEIEEKKHWDQILAQKELQSA